MKGRKTTDLNAEFHAYLQHAVQHTEQQAHVRFEPGLNDDEIALAENAVHSLSRLT